ncbi:MAG: DUF2314 domain-containing protein [Geothrix sp.]|uniref:YegJ family protein n=1 Tax=Geothrix sp. TaxID=1962974 RepID=UPI001795452C|nr:DUF2314 domain-containing protein [Geothrix sp.]NWJ42592.1 DUF2314 domain-containing protein [Geothrix sp.]WIL19450.1 MAG: DUF2314 domain-containing protein [Geothrix sp.]
MPTNHILLSFLLFATAFTACKPKAGQIVKRSGEPDMAYVAPDDQAMNAAILKARSTLSTFKQNLVKPPANATDFSVKVAFSYGPEKFEHIWLSNPEFKDGQIYGSIGNEPVDLKNFKLGQRVSANESAISDWMFLENGLLRGGFTLRVLLDKLPPSERAAQLNSMRLRLD